MLTIKRRFKIFMRIKFIFLFLSLLVLCSCSNAGPKTRVFGTPPPKVIPKEQVKAFKDDALSRLANRAMYNPLNIKSIEGKTPMFILSGGGLSFEPDYAQSLCSSINNNVLVSKKYLCLVYPLKNVQDAKLYLRKQVVSNNKTHNIKADFLITRVDYLMDKEFHNSGILKDLPKLDVVTFLNGSYLYLFGKTRYNKIEFTHYINNLAKIRGYGDGDIPTITIGVTNKEAKEMIKKLVSANHWKYDFELINLYGDYGKRNYKKVDLIADFGVKVSEGVREYLGNNPQSKYLPLTISKKTIVKTQQKYPEVSVQNTTRFYNVRILNNVKTVISDLENKQDSNAKTNNKDLSQQKNSKLSDFRIKAPFVPSPVPPTEEYYKKHVFGKTPFNFDISSVNRLTKVKTIPTFSGEDIEGIGIRNVLVSTRATNSAKPLFLLDAFLGNYNIIRSNLTTKDMQHYNEYNILFGGLYNDKLKYNFGIVNYSYLLSSYTEKLTNMQATVAHLLDSTLTKDNYPLMYGPPPPTSAQYGNISKQTYNTQLIMKRQRTLDILHHLINTLNQNIDTIDSSKTINKSASGNNSNTQSQQPLKFNNNNQRSNNGGKISDSNKTKSINKNKITQKERDNNEAETKSQKITQRFNGFLRSIQNNTIKETEENNSNTHSNNKSGTANNIINNITSGVTKTSSQNVEQPSQ